LWILVLMYSDSRENKVLNWMVESITWFQIPLKFLVNQVPIRYSRSQISELCHIFKGTVSCLFAMVLSCIMVTRQQHRLSKFMKVMLWEHYTSDSKIFW
jgi:hypothetical protein